MTCSCSCYCIVVIVVVDYICRSMYCMLTFIYVRRGSLKFFLRQSLPFIPCFEGSGVVVAVGPKVSACVSASDCMSVSECA